MNFEGQFKMQMWDPCLKIKNFKMVMAGTKLAGPGLGAFQRAWAWWLQRSRSGFEDWNVFLTPESRVGQLAGYLPAGEQHLPPAQQTLERVIIILTITE